MSVEVGVWKLGSKPVRLNFSSLPKENQLEDLLATDTEMLGQPLLLIGRQVLTGFGKYIDLLAMDGDGNLVVIELKKDKTPREIVAQVLDYGSWVRNLKDVEIASIFSAFIKKYHPTKPDTGLDQAFKAKFGVSELPETLNENHELLIVAGELDDSTERIVTYLNDEFSVSINAVFFRYFTDGVNEYITRAWLCDPQEIEAKAEERNADDEWNGEYYASFGQHDDRRNWDDARKHGYFVGGGGAWYSSTLKQLEPGNRIWVNVPGRGYVGVGVVTESAKPITEFEIADGKGVLRPIAEVVKHLPSGDKPEEELEYFVRVKWQKTVPLDGAIKEKGFFGNQNTVAKPKAKKWTHTVERLKARFGIE